MLFFKNLTHFPVQDGLGTTTDRVIAHSTVPVLVVKPINNHDH